jgi:membrane peptidoglycan carboxypeptidase
MERIGAPFRDALTSVEAPNSMPLQIARTLECGHSEKSIPYDLNQLRLSWHIRRRFSKRAVFTIYANRTYFGSGMIGVENASRQLFRKDPDNLSIQEAALIAGLVRAPLRYSPRKNPEKALYRRNEVLDAMVAQGKLSVNDLARLKASPLGVR